MAFFVIPFAVFSYILFLTLLFVVKQKKQIESISAYINKTKYFKEKEVKLKITKKNTIFIVKFLNKAA